LKENNQFEAIKRQVNGQIDLYQSYFDFKHDLYPPSCQEILGLKGEWTQELEREKMLKT
jgi:hypothetical protein